MSIKRFNFQKLPFLLDWGIPTSEWPTRRSGSLGMRPRAIGERTFSSCSLFRLILYVLQQTDGCGNSSLCASWNTLIEIIRNGTAAEAGSPSRRNVCACALIVDGACNKRAKFRKNQNGFSHTHAHVNYTGIYTNTAPHAALKSLTFTTIRGIPTYHIVDIDTIHKHTYIACAECVGI